MSDAYLGIDAGTSAIKVCAFARDGRLLGKAHRTVPVVTPYALWAEVDLERYWQATAEAISEVTARVPAVVSVGLATTCPTTVLLDEEGRAVRPGLLYFDGRAQTRLDEVVGAGRADYEALTGNRASVSTCWAANLDWLRRNEPAAWSRTRRVTMLNGYLARCLTGRDGIEPTHASYSGLMKVAAAQAAWEENLLRAWDLGRTILPEVRPCTDIVGRVCNGAAQATGLAANTPVALGAADTAAAAFAVGLVDGGEVFESVGTSGVITFSLDRPAFEPSFLNRQHVVPGRWLAHGAMSTLGGAFGWLKNKVWPEVNAFAELERYAQQSVPGANGLLFLPYLAGERSPIWDTRASGTWLGLLLRHGRPDMVRAVFEGTTYGLRQIYERGAARWNVRPSKLTGVGGGARNHFWSQMKADVLNLPYAVSPMPDAASFGAALIGAVAAGAFTGLRDPDLPFIAADSVPIQPGSSTVRGAYDETYKVFVSAYPHTKELMHALAELSPDRFAEAPLLSGAAERSATAAGSFRP